MQISRWWAIWLTAKCVPGLFQQLEVINWKREGNYSQDDKGVCLLANRHLMDWRWRSLQPSQWQNFCGEGFEFVLTERFCQDDVEEYFGYQRTQGRRNDNPTGAEFGYNDLRIATLRDVAPQTVKGNVSGRHSDRILARRVSGVV